MKKLNYYIGLADEMIQEDVDRDKLHQAMEDMHHLEWDLPGSVKNLDWIRKFISTDPFDALRAVTRLLSTVQPIIKYQPLADNQETKEAANRVEQALLWHLKNANKRGRAKAISDIVLSAARHDEIAAQVVHLDTQANATGMSPLRIRAARRNGPFAVLVRNPRFVHSRYSDWMLENVLYARTVKAAEVVDFWGDRAKAVKNNLRSDEITQYCTVYDMWDLETHAVWCYMSDSNTMLTGGAGEPITIMEPTEHGLGFIPWAVRVGGTNLDSKAEDQRYPLLYSVWKAGQWVTQNILGSLVTSEGMSYAASPRGVTYSPDPNNPPTVDYGDPGRNIDLRQGVEEYKQIAPPPIDGGLMAIADRISGSVSRSTISAILTQGDFPSGTAFSTLNLAVQSAMKALAPHKVLAENAIADICNLMLYWVDYSGKPLVAYQQDSKAQYVVNPEDFDVDNLYIEVEITPDVPTDDVATINAAAIAVTQLGMSRESGLEYAGVMNPAKEVRQAMYEQMLQNELQIVLQNQQAKAQMVIEMQAQQMRMQMEQQMMMQQQAMMQQQQQPAGNEAFNLGEQMAAGGPPTPGVPGAEGQGFNPAMGGTPPVQLSPSAGRVAQTGSDNSGVPV